MSGTNRLVQSVIVGAKGSESTLTKALSNGNEEAKKQDKKNVKKKTGK